MRVYKFLSTRYGLRDIQERRLKISEVHTLNDPFELLPFDLSDLEIRNGMREIRKQVGQEIGLLCFSQHWHNPVLWAHYADSNKGLCLGFDVPNVDLHLVKYLECPTKLTQMDDKTASKMLLSKYEHWSYEEEYRMFAMLNEKSGSFYYCNFGDNLRLVEIIVGAGSPVSERKLRQTLGANQSGVRILKARLAFDAFRVIEDERGFLESNVAGS